jgi:GT2 family glycosyltransferase
MSEASVLASVIVPSHNRWPTLARTLDALDAQSLSPDQYEVVVALDNCVDESEPQLSRRVSAAPLRHVAGNWRKASSARNAAARIARGDLLVFLDDDVVPCRNFVSAHIEAHRTLQAPGAVVGYSKPEMEGPDGWFVQVIREWWEDLFVELGSAGHRFIYSDFLTGNVSMPQALFEELGGFDEAFECREDYEFGARLLRSGARLTYAPAAMGVHHDARVFQASFARARAEGHADVQFAAKHEDLLWDVGWTWPGPHSRIARFGLRHPRLADAAMLPGLPLLSLLERMRMRGYWRRLQHALRRLAYVRGMADALGSQDGYAALIARRNAAAQPKCLDVDLEEGWAAILSRVAETAPPGLALRCRGREVARWPAMRAAAPLGEGQVAVMRSRHDVALLEHGLAAVSEAGAAPGQGGPPLSIDEKRLVTLGEVQLAPWTVFPVGDALRFPARFIVKRGRRVLGWVWAPRIPEGEQVEDHIRTAVQDWLGPALAREALFDQVRPASPDPTDPISVVVCTRDRTENLRRCLAALERLDYPDWELVVVDNAPSTSTTADLLRDMPWVRYVREDRPGLDNARNRGIAESRHGIIAFTDDDTAADPGWLQAIDRAFRDEEIAAVTGFVAPMKLDTEPQLYFEDVYGGMGNGFAPRWFRRREMESKALLWASSVGVGANMAFRRSTLERVGRFDPGLDVGTPSRGGGDVEMLHRILAEGLTIKYEPDALVWHEHRATWEALRRQLADNSCSFFCYLRTLAARRSLPRGTIAWFFVVDWLGRWFLKRLIRPKKHSRSLILSELKGLLDGPGAYRRSGSLRG